MDHRAHNDSRHTGTMATGLRYDDRWRACADGTGCVHASGCGRYCGLDRGGRTSQACGQWETADVIGLFDGRLQWDLLINLKPEKNGEDPLGIIGTRGYLVALVQLS
jgi:hypothetical protein